MISAIITRLESMLSRTRQSRMAKDVGWVLMGQGLSFFFQAGYFILLARVLGVEQYGIFAGATALASLVIPFSSLGAGMLFMRYTSTDANQFARYWGNILLSTLLANVVLISALRIIAPHFLNAASAAVIVPVSIANCLLGQLIQCAVQVYQSYRLMHLAASWSAVLNILRFGAAAFLLIFLHHATAYEWALVSVATTVMVAVAAAIAITARFGRPSLEPLLLVQRFGEGLLYSLSNSTASAYNDLDKTLLSHYGMNVANGLYTTAYRIIDLATIPVASVEWAAVPRFFQQSNDGVLQVAHLAKRILLRAALIGIAASGAAFLCAPLIPHLLGESFAQSSAALRWLCLLPLFRAIHQITGAALTGTGNQRYRTAAQVTVALLNLGLNLAWIPTHGWLGAAWASLITDGALGILCWAALSWVMLSARKRQERWPVNSQKGQG